ncbi:hypothetical protein ABE021_14020 [Sporosarcina gallistercoris]|uniref:hypothetical protein n=1 Tax=Sporosarcina gallistercoris TaxID=2762245 RepID=UPI003D2C01EC
MGAKQKERLFKKWGLIGLVSLVALFYLLHSTPDRAVRTCVFFIGHPVAAMTSDIEDDTNHSKSDKTEHEKANLKTFTLTNPPYVKATDSDLGNYQVRKYGFIYFAKFSGGMQ